MALVATIVGHNTDEDKQLAREAQIAKYLMLLYDDVFEQWSRRNANRLLGLARHACALSRLRHARPGLTSLDAFVDLRDRLCSEPEAVTAQLSEITGDEALRFLKEPNTRREVRNIAFLLRTRRVSDAPHATGTRSAGQFRSGRLRLGNPPATMVR